MTQKITHIIEKDRHGHVKHDVPITVPITSEEGDSELLAMSQKGASDIATATRDKINDLVVVDRDGTPHSKTHTDPDTGEKVAVLQADEIGKIDGVSVNGEELEVDSDGKVHLTIPQNVTDLEDAEDYATKEYTDARTIENVTATVEVGGEVKQATVTKDGADVNIDFPDLKGDKGDPLTWDDLTEPQKASLKGDPGDNCIPLEGESPLAQVLSMASTKAVTPKAVVEGLGAGSWVTQTYTEKRDGCYCRNHSGYAAYQTISGTHTIFWYEVHEGEKWKIRCGAAAETNHIDYALVSSIPETITTGTRISPYVANSGNTDIELDIQSDGYIMLSRSSGTQPVMKKHVVKTIGDIASEISEANLTPVAERVEAAEGGLESMEAAIGNISKKTTYNYTLGINYRGSAVGDVIVYKSGLANTNAATKIPCEAGDKFLISGTGFTVAPLYAWLDENNIILAISGQSITRSNLLITAPENAAYLCSNVNTANPYSPILKIEGDIELRMMSAEKTLEQVSGKVETISEKTEIVLTTNKRIGGGYVGGTLNETSGASVTAFVARKIACVEGDTFLYTGAAGDAYRLYYWLNDEEKVIDHSNANMNVKDLVLVAPPNAAWLVVNCNPAATPHSLYKIGGLEKMLWENNPASDSTKVLYGNAIHKANLEAVRFSAPSATESRGNTLTLLHFSDLHDSILQFDRIMEYANIYGSYIDDILNTGDSVFTHYGSLFFVKELYAWFGMSKKILNVIGNHDTRATDNSGWYDNAGINAYSQFIAPTVENWGVTQPDDAAEDGKCYYYKDYATQGIRLIVLDNMVMYGAHYDAEQLTWFADVLEDARTNSMSVICAKHYSSNVSPLEGAGAWHERNATDGTLEGFYDAIDDFIEQGGDFICWLSGHTHYNVLGLVTSHSSQLSIAVGSCYDDNYQYSARQGSAIDCFNMISFDKTQKRIKMMRVGNNLDWMMRKSESLCINYSTKSIISKE